jgi:putative PIN family toxin of toxin-antitoxin system
MSKGRERPRAVIDTNVFISGIISRRGNPFRLLEAWRAGAFTLVISSEQQDELRDVLSWPRLALKYQISEQEVAELFRLIDVLAETVSPLLPIPITVRDPKDEMILGSALAGRADYLVSGDDDLLVLRGDSLLGGLEIVTVREFLDKLDQ